MKPEGSERAAASGASSVVSIGINPGAGQPLVAVAQVEAVAGRGLVGDRRFKAKGRYSGKLGSGREVTLIEVEALEAFAAASGQALTALESRRNIAVRGVRLNGLVGEEFLVGEVVLRGVRLCEPCSHLAKLTGLPVVRGLQGRGGLNATIVQGGVVRVGDRIVLRTPALFRDDLE